MLVDSHCHLDFPDFADDLDGVVARAKAAGVAKMVTISTRLSAFDGVRAVADRFDGITCSVGVHPHEAGREQDISADRLIALAAHPKVVAIGETGLDFYYEHSPRDAQEASFRAHIAASRATGLPLVVHSRDADDETVRVLLDEYKTGPFPGLIHCFTGGPDLAAKAVEIGFYISLSGIVTFKTAEALRATVRQVPADRLLVETDSPYLAPIPKRGQRNEPAFVAHTAAKLAEIKGWTVAEAIRLTGENFERLFAKAAA